jgi:hypothetical protein
LKEALSYGLRPTLGHAEASSAALSALRERENGWRHLHFSPLHVEGEEITVQGVIYNIVVSGDHFYTNAMPDLSSPTSSSYIMRGHIPTNSLDRTWLSLPFSEDKMLQQFVVDAKQDVIIWANYHGTECVVVLHTPILVRPRLTHEYGVNRFPARGISISTAGQRQPVKVIWLLPLVRSWNCIQVTALSSSVRSA